MKYLTALLGVSLSLGVNQAYAIDINSCDELKDIPDGSSETYVLQQKIDCIGVTLFPIQNFHGTFSGNNHTISNLSISAFEFFPDASGIGLFGTASDAKFENLILDKVSFQDNTYASPTPKYIGLLLGHGINVLISNVQVINSSISKGDGATRRFAVGGVVGSLNKSQDSAGFYNVQADVDISVLDGANYVGGLGGEMQETTITDSRVSGSVSGGIPDSGSGVGGAFGYLQDVTLQSSSSKAKVEGLGGYVGGLIGQINPGKSVIENCYAQGAVSNLTPAISEPSPTGGLIGGIFDSNQISNCYSTGKVTAIDTRSNIGGLVGRASTSLPPSTNSFWDLQTSGQATSAVGEGKTEEQMKNINTYIDAGWDFTNIWSMTPGAYPSLRN